MKESILGTEKISKLIRKFSIPCVISMVVAALYNIVDQIFIGWSEAGAYGNAATNIVYPATVFALGIALLIGDGAAANFSLSLGQGRKDKAEKFIGNGLVALIIAAVVFCAAGFLFKNQILAIFGADPAEELCYKYANDYYKIICSGFIFYMIGQGLNASIRADGAPGFAMAATLAGAITNLIGDPLLIFGFGLGIKGAAYATVAGQIVTFGMSIVYLFRSRNFKLTKDSMRIRGNILGKILPLGLASLIVQLSIVIIIAVNNNMLTKYGYVTYASTGEAFGAVTPLAVVGIVMKVFGIVVSTVIGISLGGQPILGFNMGAGNVDRVKETIQVITRTVLIVGAAAFLIFELAPGAVIALFGVNNGPEYMEYANLCIRIFLGGIILTCYIKSAAVILQAMGNSVKSTVLALMRDVIVFVPATLIIGTLTQNIVSMLWAALISDVVSGVVAFVFVSGEIRKYQKLMEER